MPDAGRARVLRRVLLTAAMLAALSCQRAAPSDDGSGSGRGRLVRIAAASDLRYALDALRERLLAERPDLDVQVAYGSSGTFVAQLANGAPFDLFMSADVDYPRQLARRGLTVPGSEFTYAIGHLVVWAPSSSPLDVERGGMGILTDERVAHVSIAHPEHAPYGRAAVAAMRGADVYDRVQGKIVLGENVTQALQFVQSGAAEVGLVALSLAMAPPVRSSGKFWRVPSDLHPPLEQGGVIMGAAADLDAARAIRAYVLSEAGQDIFEEYGFVLPGS